MIPRALPFLLLAALLAPAAAPSPGLAFDPPDAPRRLALSTEAALLAPDRSLPLPAQAEGIGPGTALEIAMEDGTYLCTAAFVFAEDQRLLLGTAGHCLLPSGKKATHGKGADHTPSKEIVRACVADCRFGGITGNLLSGKLVELGSVVYARQQSPEGAGFGHDFGLVEIPQELHPLVRPALPVWGGPSTADADPMAGDSVCMYGAGIVYGETWLTMARTGVAVNEAERSWVIQIPSEMGDSGSAVVACERDGTTLRGTGALGILTHGIGPTTIGTTIERALEMALEDAGLRIQVVTSA